MGNEGVEDQRRHSTAVTSQNGCLKAWSESWGKHGIALDEDWYDVRHGQLIITPDGTAKERPNVHRGYYVCQISSY